MPTYEYICNLCQHEFETFQNMSADPLKNCPECHKDSLKRKIGTGAGIIFKGNGFYETDYRSENYNTAAKKEKEASTATKKETKEDVKKDTKTPKKAKNKDK